MVFGVDTGWEVTRVRLWSGQDVIGQNNPGHCLHSLRVALLFSLQCLLLVPESGTGGHAIWIDRNHNRAHTPISFSCISSLC